MAIERKKEITEREFGAVAADAKTRGVLEIVGSDDAGGFSMKVGGDRLLTMEHDGDRFHYFLIRDASNL